MTILKYARELRWAEREACKAVTAAADAVGTEHYAIAYDYFYEAERIADRATRRYVRETIAAGGDPVRATHSCWRIKRIARNT